MDEVGRTARYLFILALVLILVAYYAGTNQLGQTLFSGVNQLGLTFTGRNAQGQFAAYPTGGSR
jgi:hypothetical protein